VNSSKRKKKKRGKRRGKKEEETGILKEIWYSFTTTNCLLEQVTNDLMFFSRRHTWQE
jgi:hypothetical protein